MNESFLVRSFREFYTELAALRDIVRTDSQQSENLIDSLGLDGVSGRLRRVLDRQAALALQAGDAFAGGVFSDVQYVMCALADEEFINLDWAGQEGWSENLLESHFFQSHSAGQTFFNRIDLLVRGRDLAAADLARIHLMALALGFEGRYRNTEDGHLHINAYKQKLLAFLGTREPELLTDSARLFPEAYANTLDQGIPRTLPYVRRWIAAGLLVLAVWVVGGHWVWRGLVGELRPTIDNILRSTEGLSASR